MSEQIEGCADHGCVVVKPTGMGTNGGCRCDEQTLRRALKAERVAVKPVLEAVEQLIAARRSCVDLDALLILEGAAAKLEEHGEHVGALARVIQKVAVLLQAGEGVEQVYGKYLAQKGGPK